ncbi:cytochrome c family protein [Roseibium polysiphoniae]|uniref:Cytochrome c family protein n=1 Tax=Roseibium polysiphoniae TaxID=2571221 RepID=A0A944CDI7_9HYPH|nr:cytochrome c family protein [Roseibium polysiphoniae]MBS8261446.1 cytochrome c family protein [Roseibium polysiphoniae]
MKRIGMIAGAALLALSAQAHSEGDSAAGEKVFKKCKACHAVGEGAKNKVGPELNAIIGRPIASIEGFKYSKSMIEFGADGKVWDEETLVAYLTKPKAVVPKTKMAFAGLRKEKDRDNILAYLKQFQ